MSDNSTDVLSGLGAKRPQRRSPKRAPREPAPPGDQRDPDLIGAVTPPSNGEVLTSALSLAGELAELGLSVTEQVLRAAIRRIPKP